MTKPRAVLCAACTLGRCQAGAVTKESLLILALVACVGVASFGSLGGAMSIAIDGDVNATSRANASTRANRTAVALTVQAAVWTAAADFLRTVRASDEILFREWVDAVAETRREFNRMTAEGHAAGYSFGSNNATAHYLKLAVRENKSIVERTLATGARTDAVPALVHGGYVDEGLAIALRDTTSPADTQRGYAVALVANGKVDEARAIAARMYARGYRQMNADVAFAHAMAQIEDGADPFRAFYRLHAEDLVKDLSFEQRLHLTDVLLDWGATEEARVTLDAIGEIDLQHWRRRAAALREKMKAIEAGEDVEQSEIPALERRRLLEKPDVAERIEAIKRSGAWVDWLPEDDAGLRDWGAAFAHDWRRLIGEVDGSKVAAVMSGVVEASRAIDEDFVPLFQWVRRNALAGPGANDVIEELSHTPMPALQAQTSLRSMGLLEPRPLTRGFLVEHGWGASHAEALSQKPRPRAFPPTHPVVSGAPRSIAGLQSLFAATGGEQAIVRIRNLGTFAAESGESSTPEMIQALAHLMDNHPRVMVVGEARDPTNIASILREQGRFGSFYSRTAPWVK